MSKKTISRKVVALGVLCTLAGCAAGGGAPGATADGVFSYQLENPRVRIRIPELPPIRMGKHPLARADKPHLRAYGTTAPFTISVLTPTADRGMSSQHCAQSTASWLIKRHGLARKDYLLFKGANVDTYGFIYAKRTAAGPQLVAYLLSGYEGTHCIEVHVSRMTSNPEDVRRWAMGFPKATIEKY